MLENRPIVAITIGYIIGIILGLYCKISIVFLYLFIFILYLLFKKPRTKKFKLISIRRYFRYVKLIITKKVLFLIILISIISNTITLYQNYQYKNLIENLSSKEIKTEGIIISNARNKDYKNIYIIKIKNKNFYLNIKKSSKIYLAYGDRINLTGVFIEPETRRNYKGFDYSKYLKTIGIYGSIDVKSITKISSKQPSFKVTILNRINTISNKIINLYKDNFADDISNILTGIILGHTDEIDINIKEEFSESNISHILAVSGMHVGYLIIFCKTFFQSLFGKRKTYFLTIIILIFYMCLTGLSPSVVRASIMACLIIVSKLIYTRSDVWTNLSISLLVLLISNPFCIENISLTLSYIGTIGILIYSINFKFKNKVLNALFLTISVTIFLNPVLAVYFNKIPIFSLFISSVIGVIILPIIILGFSFVFFSRIPVMKNFIKKFLCILVKILLKITKIGKEIPLNKIYVITPNIATITMYYLFVFTVIFIYSVYFPKKKQNKIFNRRIKNLISLLKYRFNQKKKKVISIILVISLILLILKIIPKDLKVHFIDVGQGDSCLIITPNNKKILIDGGGSENYDVGKKVLLPYLLARGIKKIDFVIVSHFDTDHIRTGF